MIIDLTNKRVNPTTFLYKEMTEVEFWREYLNLNFPMLNDVEARLLAYIMDKEPGVNVFGMKFRDDLLRYMGLKKNDSGRVRLWQIKKDLTNKRFLIETEDKEVVLVKGLKDFQQIFKDKASEDPEVLITFPLKIKEDDK